VISGVDGETCMTGTYHHELVLTKLSANSLIMKRFAEVRNKPTVIGGVGGKGAESRAFAVRHAEGFDVRLGCLA
jgi:hypothetical protein